MMNRTLEDLGSQQTLRGFGAISKVKRPFASLSDDKENLANCNVDNVENWQAQPSPLKKRNTLRGPFHGVKDPPKTEKPCLKDTIVTAPTPTPISTPQTANPATAAAASAFAPAPVLTDTRSSSAAQDDGARIALSASLGSVENDEEVVGRLEERAELESFLEECFVQKQSGSLYVSGRPGTGKTCSVQAIAKKWRRKVQGLKVVNINCMSLPSRSLNTVLGTFCSELGVRSRAGGAGTKNKEEAQCRAIKTHLNKNMTPVLFIVDEVDQLVLGQKPAQNTLYCVLGLAKHLSSTEAPVAMIAIANAVDLLTRAPNSGRDLSTVDCKSLLFAPYTAAQLREVVTKRLSTVDKALIDQVKVQLSVMQAAKLHGDCRKALALCKQAIMEPTESAAGDPGSVAPTRSLQKDSSDPRNIIAQLPVEQQIILVAFVVKNQSPTLKAADVRKRFGELATKLGLGGAPPMKLQIIEMMGTLQQRGLLKLVSKKGAEPQGELTMPFDVVKENLLQANPALRRENVLQ
jgi:Cdc6-like AAA superfamily ATPase